MCYNAGNWQHQAHISRNTKTIYHCRWKMRIFENCIHTGKYSWTLIFSRFDSNMAFLLYLSFSTNCLNYGTKISFTLFSRYLFFPLETFFVRLSKSFFVWLFCYFFVHFVDFYQVSTSLSRHTPLMAVTTLYAWQNIKHVWLNLWFFMYLCVVKHIYFVISIAAYPLF